MYAAMTKFVFLVQILMVFSLDTRKVYSDDSERIKIWNRVEEEIGHSSFSFGSIFDFNLSPLKGVDLSSSNFNNVTKILEVFSEQARLLTSGPSLRETAEFTDKNIKFPTDNELVNMLKAYNPILADFPPRRQHFKQAEDKVFDAINRVLNFYHHQVDEIKKGDTALALLFLKDIDNKHGKILQEKFPLDQWINRVCESTGWREGDFCNSLARQWTTSSRKNRPSVNHWKSAQLIHTLVNQMDNKMLENVGNEKEEMWGPLNGQCQTAVVNRCEIPYVCERTLMDPTPRSQYLLTHQLFQRLLVDTVDCPNTKKFVSEQETYTNLCAKMYMEAKYLDALGVPVLQRDLFSEYVGFCGYMGYTNFLREDWIDRIISWQSKSDNGCFVKDPLTPVGVISTDVGFKRRASQKELDQGIEQPNEKCLPHFTAVSLMALSAHWDYLMDAKAMK